MPIHILSTLGEPRFGPTCYRNIYSKLAFCCGITEHVAAMHHRRNDRHD